MRAFLDRVVALSCFVLAVAAHAQTAAPSALEPWRGWVSHGQEFRACPLIAGKAGKTEGDFLCAWPGVLALDADAGGANVRQRWRVDAESAIPLPGDAQHWPVDVTVDGRPVPVVGSDAPIVRLAPGSYEIRARIPWQERPETLRVPASAGFVALSVDGKAVAPVQRDGDDVTLGRAASHVPEADSMALRVYRRLDDDVPAMLTTRIEIDVSGQAREEVIGPALPDGFVPLALTGEWPARLDADGRVRVRVQPGSDALTLTARATSPLARVVAHVPAAPWPKQEIWSYAANPRLRITTASSAVQVDPREADVPQDWRDVPAFALGDGATLAIEERTRGLASDDRNRLTLDREMWLDFDGAGWFARDRVQGEMLRGWRLEAAAPYSIDRADAVGLGHDGNEALLVTHGAKPELSGVEWRTPAVDLSAALRIAKSGASLPVTGWQDTFDRVTATLHLPDGYRLLGAPGADSAGGSWISRWTVLDVFIAAIVVLLAWRALGLVGGAAAALYLVLGYQESGAPMWTLLAAIAFVLVARALPPGRLATAAGWMRRATLLLLVLVTLPFVAGELRYALHPQLETSGGYPAELAIGGSLAPAAKLAQDRDAAPPPAPPATLEPRAQPSSGAALERVARDASKTVKDDNPETVTVTGTRVRRLDFVDHYSESTIVQTGAGEPRWQRGQRYVLGWSGPVLPNQDVRLVIAPPWLVRALRVVLVALLAWLVVRLILPALRMPPRATAAAFVVLASAGFCASSPARAQAFPPEGLLDELRSRIAEAPKCAPECAAIESATATASGDEISVALVAHAVDRVALPLPIDERTLALRSVAIDGAQQDAFARADGEIWIAISRGVHRVELAYTAAADKVALAFPLKPMHVAFSGTGWEASGIGDGQLLTETLTLARARAEGAMPATSGAQQFAPFVRVERFLNLGLDWTAETRAHRLAPEDGGFAVAIPVLAGEHVLTPGTKIENGRATIAIADGEDSAAWSSRLDKSDALTLTAPPLADRAEVWRVVVSPTWHVEFDGVPPVAMTPDEDAQDYRNFEFHPLPGETLTLRIARPAAAEGSTRAIDSVRLVETVGQRASTATLSLSMRASQGGEEIVTLPPGLEIVGARRNGEALNLRARDGKLVLPVVPGTQSFEIDLRDATPAGFVARTPSIGLGSPAANIDLALELAGDRWLLAARGPAAGPAVLYWSELAVMLLVAWALARTRRTPLKLRQWVLLGIGFSTFSWLALIVVVAWLFAIEWRARWPQPRSALAFDFAQIGLVLLTLVALLCLVAAVPQGLLGSPDMHVAGNNSYGGSLHWFADRSMGSLPQASAISVPLWIYKLLMLAWALWLANAVVGWLRHGFAAWLQGGHWRALRQAPAVDIPAAVAPPAAAP